MFIIITFGIVLFYLCFGVGMSVSMFECLIIAFSSACQKVPAYH